MGETPLTYFEIKLEVIINVGLRLLNFIQDVRHQQAILYFYYSYNRGYKGHKSFTCVYTKSGKQQQQQQNNETKTCRYLTSRREKFWFEALFISIHLFL